MSHARKAILLFAALAVAGCAAGGLSSGIPSDPNIPPFGESKYVNDEAAPGIVSGAFQYKFEKKGYQEAVQRAYKCLNPRCRGQAYERAAGLATNDRDYYLAAKNAVEAYTEAGDISYAMTMAANANRTMPDNKSFIAYMVRNGLRPYDPNYVPDVGFSRADLFAIASVAVTASMAAAHLACGTGDCNAASSSATPARPSSSTPSVAAGQWRITGSTPISGWTGRRKYYLQCSSGRKQTVFPCSDGKWGTSCTFGGTHRSLEAAADNIC